MKQNTTPQADQPVTQAQFGDLRAEMYEFREEMRVELRLDKRELQAKRLDQTLVRVNRKLDDHEVHTKRLEKKTKVVVKGAVL